ncbi:hypothetical protein evm_014051 [Chilo suppressalis]|nr:hypothetical protein evm_014051 [Chilo suppressalis]
MIIKDTGIREVICKICCQKLIDAYNLKVQIESSEEVLSNAAGLKKVSFGNISDLKSKIDIEIKPKFENIQNNYFENGEIPTFYNNTSIKKIEVTIKNESEPLSVIDFLNNFKADSDPDFNPDSDIDAYAEQSDDEDYRLPLSHRKLAKSKKKSGKLKKENVANSKKVLIKPIFLNDIGVMPTKNIKLKKKLCTNKAREKKYDMCNYCGKMSTSIKTHLLIHTGNRSHKCDICSKAFFTSKNLDLHIKLHNKQKTFKCEKCVASFTTIKLLESHNVSHTDEKTHVCDICKKPFKRRSSLLRHKRIHNIANKCMKCDLCNMSFFTNHGLKHHLRVHTGERPYKCELCSQPYSYKHDFNRHCFNKHGIFLKRRSVYVMNEEVLKRERALMRDLMLKVQGIVKEGEPLNPFEVEGPQAALAFEQAIKALEAKKICVDSNY